MNNFKEYGFEADFKGEILKKIIGRGVDDGIATDRLIGFIKDEYGIIKIAEWWDDGILRDTCKLDKKYNLKPIKKEWYENPKNFPCLIKQINCIDDNEIEDDFLILRNIDDYNKFGGDYRHATREEVLSLLIKE